MHDFRESLNMSHRAADWPGWASLYKRFFPTMIGFHDHRQDGDHQRAGIDRSVVLEHAKTIWIDEKVRGRNRKTGLVYDDILLELFSDVDRQSLGWVVKPLQCDYIAYLIAPLGRCYLLPVLQLQLAWSRHGQRWQKDYGHRHAQNPGWTTVSVPVPVMVLMPAIGGALRGTFDPWECDSCGRPIAAPAHPEPIDGPPLNVEQGDLF